jgi:hypothetical protein
VSVFDPITYGENAFVNGQLVGEEDQAGQIVTLQESPFPFTTWTDVATTTTDYLGYYSFKRHPAQTTRYRTAWQGQLTSEREVQAAVAPRIQLRAAPAGRNVIRYTGRFSPALPGQRVALQRQAASGAWTTIATPALRSGLRFQGRLRARSAVVLRAFFATDGAHLDGFSNAVRVVPVTRRARASAAGSGCPAPTITRTAFRPSPPITRRGATLRVSASLPGGRLLSVDVYWGEGDQRDHLTLAPSERAPKYTFALRHRYATAGRHRLTVRVYGLVGDCKRGSRALHPVVRVARP